MSSFDESASQSSFSESIDSETEFSKEESLETQEKVFERSKEEVETPKEKENYSLWAWPLNEDGFVKAVSRKDKFRVALDFKYLLSRDADIRKFDTCKSGTSSYTFTIGLCSIKRADLSFWRLEIHLFNVNDMILIETFREVFHDYSNIESVRVNKKLRKLRKTYRLPSQYDITTATVTVDDSLGAVVIEALPKSK